MLMNKLAELEQDPPSATEWRGASISDPDDIPILACALAAKAPFFVTADKALLALGMIEGMAIVSPRECWELMASCEGV